MPNLVVVGVALALAAILWRIVRWIARQSNATRKDDELPADKVVTTDTIKLSRDKTSEVGLPASSNLTSTTESCILVKADLQQSSSELISEQSRTKALNNCRDMLQLELSQERKLRERAEDWAEFLTLELEAHIWARIQAERRSRRLERKMNFVSPKVLSANDCKPVSRNFKDIGEAHETWQKMCDIRNTQWEPDCVAYKQDHDEIEWHQIVDSNKRFLQTVDAHKKQKDNSTSTSNRSEAQSLQGNRRRPSTDDNKEDVNNEKINITLEACSSPGVAQKMLERTAGASAIEANDRKSDEDLTKLRLPSQDQQNFNDERMKLLRRTSNSTHETIESDRIETDKNPFVCTDSLSNIKKTTEIWENLSVSRETLSSVSSGEESSPTSADKKGLQGSCNDIITPGLVQKNLKMYEASETVENMENK